MCRITQCRYKKVREISRLKARREDMSQKRKVTLERYSDL